MSSSGGGRLLCLGFGYTARYLARQLGPEWTVAGSVRGDAPAPEGVRLLRWQDAEAVEQAIEAASHVLVTAPPGENGDPVLLSHAEALRRAGELAWVGYLSTTGVYGDHGGAWIDETAELRPENARSRRRVTAERDWTSLGLPLHVFRLPAIYGPGRSAFDRLRQGTARRVVAPGQLFCRIHVGDIAATLSASMRAPAPGAVYNVSDDLPAPPQDVIAYAADLLGMPAPPEENLEDAGLSEMARSFYGASKRISNRRICEELGVSLGFPDYKVGLKAILAAGG